MTQSTYDRIAEIHHLASHAHLAAAVAHAKGDHLTAHELSRQALEHSKEAYRYSEQARGASVNPVTVVTMKAR
jgi:retron-type reverse transcriptase